MVRVKKAKKSVKKRKKPVKKNIFEKTKYWRKIDGALLLQKTCKKFDVRFEPVKCFNKTIVRSSDLVGSNRVIARTDHSRRDFVTKRASNQRLKKIAQGINYFTDGKRFILQKVGLKQSIQSYGTILVYGVHRGNSRIHISDEKEYIHRTGGNIIFLAPGGTTYKTRKGRIQQDSANAINKTFGNQNISGMAEYIAQNIGDGMARLRYVRYKGRKPCFYDMTGSYQ